MSCVSCIPGTGRPREAAPAPVRWLRALHTGSVNDYAPLSAGGLGAVLVVLLLGHSA